MTGRHQGCLLHFFLGGGQISLSYQVYLKLILKIISLNMEFWVDSFFKTSLCCLGPQHLRMLKSLPS